MKCNIVTGIMYAYFLKLWRALLFKMGSQLEFENMFYRICDGLQVCLVMACLAILAGRASCSTHCSTRAACSTQMMMRATCSTQTTDTPRSPSSPYQIYKQRSSASKLTDKEVTKEGYSRTYQLLRSSLQDSRQKGPFLNPTKIGAHLRYHKYFVAD